MLPDIKGMANGSVSAAAKNAHWPKENTSVVIIILRLRVISIPFIID
jgi:hypothetical protein